MKLTIKKELYYFDVPTLIFCEDERENNFIFVLLDDEKLTFIGKKINAEDSGLCLNGKMDLRTVYETSSSRYFIGVLKTSKSLEAEIFSGEVTEEMLPAEGLMMTPPDKLLSALEISASTEMVHSEIIGFDSGSPDGGVGGYSQGLATGNTTE